MQSAAKPFVKEKWDETAYCIVQVWVRVARGVIRGVEDSRGVAI